MLALGVYTVQLLVVDTRTWTQRSRNWSFSLSVSQPDSKHWEAQRFAISSSYWQWTCENHFHDVIGHQWQSLVRSVFLPWDNSNAGTCPDARGSKPLQCINMKALYHLTWCLCVWHWDVLHIVLGLWEEKLHEEHYQGLCYALSQLTDQVVDSP